jgi:hypothetical protein
MEPQRYRRCRRGEAPQREEHPVRRSLIALVIAVVVGLLVAAPAGAKPGHGPDEDDGGISQVVITGGDLGRPIRLTGGGEIEHLATATYLTQSLDRFVPTENPAPSGELGPRYDISYLLTFDTAKTLGFRWPKLITQRLYPFAEGGPAVFTPEQGLTASGWWAAAERLTGFFATHGITAPVEDHAPAPSPALSPWWWLAAVLFVAGGLLVLRLAARRPSRVL